MLRRTLTLTKQASTHSGMRRILKRRLPVPKYIELAVKAGTYKTPSIRPNYLGLHDDRSLQGLSPMQREEQRVKLNRGVLDFPEEYEILSLNPPLPLPPRTPVRIKKKIAAMKVERERKEKKERKKREILGLDDDEEEEVKELPSLDRLITGFLRRHEDKLTRGMGPDHSKQEEEYYSQLLLGHSSTDANDRPSKSSLKTAMGRKSILVENAYAFALRQQQILLQGDVKGIRESAERVEELLGMEARANRKEGSEIATEVKSWREGRPDTKDKGYDKKTDTAATSDSIPSILHSRPRAVRALSLWTSRLQSIPYSRWTIGASTALDHWIAREVLSMSEETWDLVLEGGGADVGKLDVFQGESRRGLVDRMRHIVVVREALFPETIAGGGIAGEAGELSVDLEADETSKSIDELLASLGQFDDDMDGNAWKFDDEIAKDEKKALEEEENPEEIESIIDELQVWRERNVLSPYDGWDVDRKKEFDHWIKKYISTLNSESDNSKVDMEATRTALLSQRPIDSSKTKDFWNKVRTESEAEVFLQDYRSHAKAKLQTLSSSSSLTDEEEKLKSELQAIISVPFSRQLHKIVDMGTLRPILDEYTTSSERDRFFENHTSIFLEGMELEHLVPDPDGPIQLEDLSHDLRDEMSQQWSLSDANALTGGVTNQEPRFAIRMIAYGSDEFGTSRAERARDFYRMWNEHKANRARFEEAMFKKGYIGLEEDRVPDKMKSRGKKNNESKR